MLKVWELEGLKLLSERYALTKELMNYELNVVIVNSLKSPLPWNSPPMHKSSSSLINLEISSGKYVLLPLFPYTRFK